MARPVVALLSDFGLQDHYVGTMKGVMLGICPEATLADITHDVPPQDILAGALELAAAAPYFPSNTVFLCVVDPGVGSSRRAIALRVADQFFVAPDNGLVSLAVGDRVADVVELTNPRYALPIVSRTFEGRDRFAPAAAWIASGVPLSEFGPRVASLVRVDLPKPRVSESAIDGEVLRVDRFGNVVTNISADTIDRFARQLPVVVRIAHRSLVRLASTYAEIPPGDLGALVGSAGYLELAVSGGSAARSIACGRGTPVHVSHGA